MSDLAKALDAYRHALLHHDEMGGCDPNDCEVWEEEKANARAAVLSALPTKAQIDRMVEAVPMVEDARDATPEDWDAIDLGEIIDRKGLRAALYRAAGIEGEA